VLLLGLGVFIGISLYAHKRVNVNESPPANQISSVYFSTVRNSRSSRRAVSSADTTNPPAATTTKPSCALLFFGVPRLFRQAALPSIQRYLIETNPDCDVFVHTYNITKLSVSRNNETNGILVPRDIYMLHPKAAQVESVQNVQKMRDIVFFRKHHYKGWGDCCSSTINMVKQWHSINGAWGLMEQYARRNNKKYDRVGLFRLDVFYTHPIYVVHPSSDDNKEEAVVPSFLWQTATPEMYSWNFTNDRMFYGKYNYAKIWATKRFDTVLKYVKRTRTRTKKEMLRHEQGIHSESFMDYLLRDIPKVQKKPICFWRLRTTGVVQHDDCNTSQTLLNMEQNKEILLKSMDCCWNCTPSQYICAIKRKGA
jgi:hypothetical protein